VEVQSCGGWYNWFYPKQSWKIFQLYTTTTNYFATSTIRKRLNMENCPIWWIKINNCVVQYDVIEAKEKLEAV